LRRSQQLIGEISKKINTIKRIIIKKDSKNMSFPLSPGVYTREIDLTATVTGTSTTAGAIAGIYTWGPMFLPTLIGSEQQLAQQFGPPSNLNAETWFSGANFLGYSNALWVCRTANTTANGSGNTAASNTAVNAVANTGAIVNILNDVVLNSLTFATQTFTDTNVLFIAKYPGALGNSLRIAQCDSPTAYSSNVSFSGTIVSGNGAGNSYTGSLSVNIGANTGTLIITPTAGSNVATGNIFATALLQNFTVGDNLLIGNSNVGTATSNILKITAFSNAITNATVTAVTFNFQNSLRVPYNVTANTVRRYWEFYNYVTAPGETPSVLAATANSSLIDQVSFVVVDQGGSFSGVPGTILETYNNLSFATDAINADASTAYYRNVINQQSKYIWAVNDRAGVVSNTSLNLVNATTTDPLNLNFVLGQDGDSESATTLQTLANGWQLFTSKEFPISLMITGHPLGGTGVVNGGTYNNFQLANWIVQNILPLRKPKDCVVFASPDKATVLNNSGQEAVSIVNWSSFINPSTYLVLDTGYKYQYDRYNNIYRWIPMNGDVAGCCAFTDAVAAPWFAPAGINRGLINNVTKLAYNPQETDRDYLYPNAINPIVSEAGYGVYLDGQRTFTVQSSAFNRINVRRLFIYLEVSIAKAVKTLDFEINDAFLQTEFKNMVNPFLKTVQGARGIYDFIVICDSSNNTADVVDANEFVAGIYIKPARVAEYMRIDFVAVSDSVTFSSVESSQF
jgi:hypothetical protein